MPYVDIAIEKLMDRQELDKERARRKITKTKIAERAETSVGAVSQFFSAKIDSVRIEQAANELIEEKEANSSVLS